MKTQYIWSHYNKEIYFFILKKVKDKGASKDIYQNVFLKVHKNIAKVRDEKKIKAWIFQITRNEIADYFKMEEKNRKILKSQDKSAEEVQNDNCLSCCLEKFINNLQNI